MSHSQTMPPEYHGKPIVGKIRALDIMVERGKRAIMWEGNQRYSETVVSFIPEYKKARTNKEKTKVTDSIVYKIRESGARFLKEYPKDSGTFVEVPPEFATKKVGQALRHFIRAQKQNELSKPPAARSKKALAAKKRRKTQVCRKVKASKQAVPDMQQSVTMKRDEAPLNENDWIRGGFDMVPSDEEESNLEALLSSESVFEFEFVDDDVPMSVTSGGDSTASNSDVKAPAATAGFSVLRDATHKGMGPRSGGSIHRAVSTTQIKESVEERFVSTLHHPNSSRSTLGALSQFTQAKRLHGPQFAFAAAQCGPPRPEIPRRISMQTVDLPNSNSTGVSTTITKPHASTDMSTRPPRDDEEDFLQMIDSTLGPF